VEPRGDQRWHGPWPRPGTAAAACRLGRPTPIRAPSCRRPPSVPRCSSCPTCPSSPWSRDQLPIVEAPAPVPNEGDDCARRDGPVVVTAPPTGEEIFDAVSRGAARAPRSAPGPARPGRSSRLSWRLAAAADPVEQLGARNLGSALWALRCPAADLFGHKGRAWLARQDLPQDGQAAAATLLRQLDFSAEQLRLIDADRSRGHGGPSGGPAADGQSPASPPWRCPS
jgi:hypothetical protein